MATIWIRFITGHNAIKGDLIGSLTYDTADDASRERIDRLWRYARSKGISYFATWGTNLAERAYKPYTEEQKKRLRATLARKKREKKIQAIRDNYPLFAENIIAKEFPPPPSGHSGFL